MSWNTEELEQIAAAEELELTTGQASGAAGSPARIWVVRVGDDLYVRAWRGATARWFLAVQARPQGHVLAGEIEKDVGFALAEDEVNEAVDAAYREKYSHSSHVDSMVNEPARSTTLRLVPS